MEVQFLERHKSPIITQEETDHLNRPMSTKYIDSIVNNFQNKATISDEFTGKYQTLKEETLIFHNLL